MSTGTMSTGESTMSMALLKSIDGSSAVLNASRRLAAMDIPLLTV